MKNYYIVEIGGETLVYIDIFKASETAKIAGVPVRIISGRA